MESEFELVWNVICPPRHLGDSDEVPDPVGSMFQRAAFPSNDTLAKSNWDDELGGGQAIAKRTAESPFAKGTAAHEAGLTHIEEREIDGDIWSYGFRGDELVDVKLVCIG